MKLGGENDFESEINIIPLVDVVLVLLIIFMVTAPMMKYSIDVSLPSAETSQQVEDKENIEIVIRKSGEIEVDGRILKDEEFEMFISKSQKKPILISADKEVKYEKIVYVLDVFRKYGFEKIGIITQKK